MIFFLRYSIFNGVVLLIFIVCFVFAYKYLLGFSGELAKSYFQKSIDEFKKYLDITFRDEPIRSELITHFSKQSIEKKYQIYQDVYSLYFEYQKSWSFNKDTPTEDIDELWKRILQMRQKIFLNSIYLGGDFTDSLLQAVVSMMESLELKLNHIRSPLGAEEEEIRLRSKITREVTDFIRKAEKWIVENLGSNQTIKQYEFTEEQRERIEKEREKIISKRNK
jgi:hypothetical protein